jgi:hypothetical protein
MALKLGVIVKENETMRDVWFTSDFHFGHFSADAELATNLRKRSPKGDS